MPPLPSGLFKVVRVGGERHRLGPSLQLKIINVKMTHEPFVRPAGLDRESSAQFTEIRVRGKTVKVPSTCIQGRTIIVKGKWVKLAAVKDEDCLEGDVVDNPDLFVTQLKEGPLKVDLFTFAEEPTSTKPEYGYHIEWDSAAIIPIRDYAGWWEKLPQETRRNVRKAAKCGVDVKAAPFNDELVRGIVDIYNETPMRQGKRFWHYGKSFEIVREETATYLERSEFIGAYCQDALIGFIKVVYVHKCARIIHILSKEQHADKRPTNALIAKAVQVCAEKGITSLQYQKYIYGGNQASPLTEFKRRNRFEEVRYPRYYIPISTIGKLALKLKLHHGLIHLLPEKVSVSLRSMRKRALEILCRIPLAAAKSR
jgi:hypothetical protein